MVEVCACAYVPALGTAQYSTYRDSFTPDLCPLFFVLPLFVISKDWLFDKYIKISIRNAYYQTKCVQNVYKMWMIWP